MVEESQDPVRDFPKMMLTGLGITGLIYVLVSITAVALVPVGELDRRGRRPALIQVVAAGAPDLPIDKIFPFIGDVRGRQLRADQHADGQPAALRHGQRRTCCRARSARCTRARRTPWVGDHLHDAARLRPDHLRRPRERLRGRCVQHRAARRHHRAAAALRLHRRQHRLLVLRRDPVDHDHFRRRRCCRTSVRCSAPSWSVRGRATRSSASSTRSRRACWSIGVVLWVVACADQPRTAPTRRGSATSARWRSRARGVAAAVHRQPANRRAVTPRRTLER